MSISRAAMAAKKVIDAAWQHGPAYDLSSQAVFALEAAGLLQSPESAAEVEQLRRRVAELEAAARTARTEAIADTGDWLDEVGEKNAAHLVYTCDIPAARDMKTVSVEDPHDSPLHHDYALSRDLPPFGEAEQAAAEALASRDPREVTP